MDSGCAGFRVIRCGRDATQGVARVYEACDVAGEAGARLSEGLGQADFERQAARLAGGLASELVDVALAHRGALRRRAFEEVPGLSEAECARLLDRVEPLLEGPAGREPAAAQRALVDKQSVGVSFIVCLARRKGKAADRARKRLEAVQEAPAPAHRALAGASRLDDPSLGVRIRATARLASTTGADELLLVLLQSGYAGARCAALEALQRGPTAPALSAALPAQLTHSSRSVRRRAAEVLLASGASTSGRVTMEPCPLVRRVLACGLSDAAELAQLVERDIDPETRLAAVEAGAGSASVLQVALLDGDRFVRARAEALTGGGGADALRAERLVDAEAWEQAIALGASALGPLLARVQQAFVPSTREAAARAGALGALGRLGPLLPHAERHRVESAACGLVADVDGRIRARALGLLETMESSEPAARAAAARAVVDREPEVRVAALSAVAGLRVLDAVLAVTLRLTDPEEPVRLAAVRALGRLGALEFLAALAGGRWPPEFVGAIARPDPAAALLGDRGRSVEDVPPTALRVEALLFLGQLPAPPSIALSATVGQLAATVPSLRQAAERAVRGQGWLPIGRPDRSGRGVESWLTPDEVAPGAFAAGGREVVLRHAANGPDPRLAAGVFHAVRRESLGALIDLARAHLDHVDAGVRLAAAEAAAALGDVPPEADARIPGARAWAALACAKDEFAVAARWAGAAFGPLAAVVADRTRHPAERGGALRSLVTASRGDATVTEQARRALLELLAGDAGPAALEGVAPDGAGHPEAAAPAALVAAALTGLVELGVPAEAVPVLVRTLATPRGVRATEWERPRSEAVRALSSLGGAAQERLRQLIAVGGTLAGGPDADVRVAAVRALAGIAGARADLLVALSDEAPAVRVAAVEALASDRAVVLPLLGDGDAGVVRAVISAVGPLVEPLSHAVALLARDPGIDGQGPRFAQADTLAIEAAPLLLHALRDRARDPATGRRRAAAARALGEHPGLRAADGSRLTLEHAASDVIPQVRAAAIGALGRIAHPESVPALGALLTHPDHFAAVLAAGALGGIEHASARTPLISALGLSDALAEPVQLGAARAITSLRPSDDAATTASLVRLLLGTGREEVRSVAEACVGELLTRQSPSSPAAVAAVVAGLEGAPLLARRALTRLLALAEVQESLLRGLDDEDSDVRAIAARGLGGLSSLGATGEPSTRRTGKPSPGGAPDASRERVIAALCVRRFDTDGEVRSAVFSALVRIGAPDHLALGALMDPATSVRSTVLGRAGDVLPGVARDWLASEHVGSVALVAPDDAAESGRSPTWLAPGVDGALRLHALATQRMASARRARLCRALNAVEVPVGAEAVLLRLAGGPDLAVAEGALLGLGVPGCAAAASEVMPFYRAGHGRVRAAALACLVGMGRADGLVVSAASDPDAQVRAASADCSAAAGEHQLECLRALVDDPAPEVRRAALRAIAARPVPGLGPAAVRWLFDSEEAVRSAAAQAFGAVAAVAQGELAAVFSGAGAPEWVGLGREVQYRRAVVGGLSDVAVLLLAARDGDPVTRAAAVDRLHVPARGSTRDDALRVAEELLADEAAAVRVAAVKCLMRAGGTLPWVLPGLLGDPDASVRSATREALAATSAGSVPSAMAAEALADHGRRFWEVRPADAADVPLLLAFVRTYRGLVDAKVGAVAALGGVATEHAALALAYCLGATAAAPAEAAASMLAAHPEARVAAPTLRHLVGGAARTVVQRALALEALAVAEPAAARPAAVELLGHPEVALRLAACRALGVAVAPKGAAGVLPGLVKALDDGAPGVRLEGARALGAWSLGPPEADALLRLSEDPDEAVRGAAADALGRRAGELRAVLRARLDGGVALRRTVVRALRRDPDSVSVLVERSDDQDAVVRHGVLWAVRDHATRLPLIDDGRLTPVADDVLERLDRRLIDADADVRGICAEALGALGRQMPIRVATRVRLVGLLGDLEARVRIAARGALGVVGNDGLSEWLGWAEDVRARRLWRLSEVLPLGADKPEAAALLAHALDLDTAGGRAWREALARQLSGQPGSLPLHALARAIGDTDPWVREAATLSLVHEAARPVAGSLRRAARETATAVRVAAIRALAACAPDEPEPILAALDDPMVEVRLAAAEGLGACTAVASAVVSALVARLAAPDLGVVAARSLGRLGQSATLVAALDSAQGDARVAVAAGLAALPPEAVDGPTLAALISLATEPVPALRVAAVAGLLSRGGEPGEVTVSRLVRDDPSPEVRLAAITALHSAPRLGAAGRSALRAALADRDPRVAEVARAAARGTPLERAPDLLDRRRASALVDEAGVDALPALLVALHDERFGADDTERRRAVASALATLATRFPGEREAVVSALALRLADALPGVRGAAARALAALAERHVAPVLAELLVRAERDERREVALALSMLDSGALGAVAVRDPDAAIRECVARATSDRGHLQLLLDDAEQGVADAAAERLAALGESSLLSLVFEGSEAVGPRKQRAALLAFATLGDWPAGVSRAVTAALGDGDPSVRTTAVRVLGLTGRSPSEALARLEGDGDDGVRWAAAIAVTELLRRAPGDASLRDALELALVDSSPEVVRQAEAALSAGQDLSGAAVEALSAVRAERWSALVALGPQALPWCRRVLRERATDRASVGRRVGVLDALSRSRAEGADELVAIASADKAVRVREGAARTAATLAEPWAALDLLAGDPVTTVRVEVCRVLGDRGGEPAVERLSLLRHDGAADVRLAAAVALAGPKTSAVTKVAELLNDPDPEVKLHACQLLEEMGHPGGIEPLIVTLGDANPRVRHGARRALISLGWTPVGHRVTADSRGYAWWTSRAEWQASGAGEREALEGALRATDPSVRRDAAEGLELLRDSKSLPALLGCLEDPDAGVREAVGAAVLTLTREAPSDPSIRAQALVYSGDPAAAVALGPVAALPLARAITQDAERSAARGSAGEPSGDSTSRGQAALDAVGAGPFDPGEGRAALEAALLRAVQSGSPVRVARAALAIRATRLGAPLIRRLSDPAAALAGASASGAEVEEVARAAAKLGAEVELFDALHAAPLALRRRLALACRELPRAASACERALGALVGEPDLDVRAALVAAACRHGDATRVTDLIGIAASDASAAAREAAVVWLGGYAASPGVRDAVVLALGDSNPEVRRAALGALGEVPSDPRAAAAVALANGRHELLVTYDEAAIGALERGLSEPGDDPEVATRRAACVRTAGRLVFGQRDGAAGLRAVPAGAALLERLTRLAADRSAVVRASVADLGAPRAGDGDRDDGDLSAFDAALRGLLADDDARVRRRAATAAGLRGDLLAVDALRGLAAADANPGVRFAAQEALASPGMRVLEPLLASLSAADPEVRAGAADALGETGSWRAVDGLAAALADGLPVVRSRIRGALERLGFEPLGIIEPSDVPAAARGTRDRVVRWLGLSDLEALSNLPPSHADGPAAIQAAREAALTTLLSRALSETDRVMAALAVTGSGALTAALEDPSPWVRLVAARRHDVTGHPELALITGAAGSALGAHHLAVAPPGSEDTDGGVGADPATAARAALWEVAVRELVGSPLAPETPLGPAVRSQEPETRRRVAAALPELLRRLLADPSRPVAGAAEPDGPEAGEGELAEAAEAAAPEADSGAPAPAALVRELLTAASRDPDAGVRVGIATAHAELAEVLPTLPALLLDLSEEVRDAAAAALVRLDASELLRAVDAPRAGVRLAAIRGLGKLREPALATAVAAAVGRAMADDDDEPVRVGAVTTAAALLSGPQSGVSGGDAQRLLDAVTHALSRDASWRVRTSAAQSLGGMTLAFAGALPQEEETRAPTGLRDVLARACRALEVALADADSSVRSAADQSLELLEYAPSEGVGEGLRRLGRGDVAGLAALGGVVVPLLARLVNARGADADTVGRKLQALDALARIGADDGDPAGAAEPALLDVSPKVRAAAVRCLTRLCAAAQVEPTIGQLLADVDPPVRRAAAAAAGALGLASAVPQLEALATADTDSGVRLAAAAALASPGIERVETLIRQLSSPDADTRCAVASRLGSTGRVEAATALVATLSDTVAMVRLEARDALLALGFTPVGQRAEPYSEGFARWLLPEELGLAPLAGRRVEPSVIAETQREGLSRLATATDPLVRLAVAEGLASLRDGGAPAFDVIRVLLLDPVRAVRRAASRLLGAEQLHAVGPEALVAAGLYREAAAAGALAQLLVELGSSDAELAGGPRRVALLRAIAECADEAALPVLTAELGHADAATRAEAARALGVVLMALAARDAAEAERMAALLDEVGGEAAAEAGLHPDAPSGEVAETLSERPIGPEGSAPPEGEAHADPAEKAPPAKKARRKGGDTP